MTIRVNTQIWTIKKIHKHTKEEAEKIYYFSRAELKNKKASDFKEGDVIKTGIYFIHIHYKSKDGKYSYDRPSLCSYHEREDFKPCGCTPGADRPYYIDDFINS